MHDDMPSFGGAEEPPKQQQHGQELPPETGLSSNDQTDAIKRVAKGFAIMAAVLVGGVLLYKAALYGWHKVSVGRVEASLQQVIDDKLIDAERKRYDAQLDDWQKEIDPLYTNYYPAAYKSPSEYEKLLVWHKRLRQMANTRLDQVEADIKLALQYPEQTEVQIRDGLTLWASWKSREIQEAERMVKDEEREVRAYFAKLKPAEPPPAASLAPVPLAAASVTPKPPQESTVDKKYLEDIQRALKGGR